jgi:RHS repeat-associated protein/uncharacterized repeat protein (TIGR01451 family)
MMQSHAPASTRKSAGYFHRNGLLSQLMSALLAWTMVMSSLPVYATGQPRAEWVHSWDVNSLTKPITEPAKHRPDPAMATRRAIAKTTVASPRLATNPTIAALHPPALPGNQGSDFLMNAFGGGLFALPLQAQDSTLEVSVGFADNTSPSANFPEPWNEANSLVNFAGSGTVYRAGAIRLDNPGSVPVTVDSVKVDLGRPGPVFQLWQNIVVPAGGSTILTQSQDGNFNTSASSIVGCGLALATNETRIPTLTVTVAGTSTDYADTAHVLDTGGFDSSCRGNQSLQWRSIGTAGPENPGGSIQLISDGAPHAVGTQDTLTVQVDDAGNVPLANAPITLSVLNGPNAGKTFSGTTDASGSAGIAYSSAVQGTDLIAATVKNASNGVMQSQQASTTWSSADVCVAPGAPNAAVSRLIYVGQNSIAFGGVLRLGALLTDGTGNPLSGRQLSFVFSGQTLLASTDVNGTATVAASTLPVGASAVSINYSGDANFQAAQLSTTVNVVPAATLLRYTGTNLITALGQQTVSAVLTNSLGTTPVAGRSVTFTLNGVSASAITGANGAATATLNFATALPTGAGQLQINFAGDSSYQASSRAVPIQIYQPMPFVIWGGNSGGLRIGQRVNFWGSQWESQVINGLYFGANPSFKGWSGSVASFNQCEANASLATLDMACWQVKPGQSFPPDQVLPAYIEVVVSTVIDKSGDTVFGNIACGAILQVDHTPPYGAVPGQDGFGTIAAVNGDCGGIFPPPAVLAASQQQKGLVLPAENITVNYSIANQGTTDATGVVLNENFDQVTPATGSANLGTIAAGLSASGNFPVAIPAISPRQGTETSVDYSSRLAAQDGRLFTSEGEISFSDPFSQLYTPLDISSFSQLTLPRLTVGVSGPTCIAPSSTLPYQITVENVGSNTATHIAATLTLPDSTTATPLVANLTAGTRFVGTVNWQAPGVAAKSSTETTDAYLARLHANDGTTLPAAVLSALWQDALSGAYGPVEQPFVTLTQRIPVVSTTVPATQALLPNQKTQLTFGVSNTGTGNAVQVTLRIQRQDGTFINVPNFSLPGGQSATPTANYQAPSVASKGVAESDIDYISRLQALNNSSLNLNAILSWTDPAQNIYGPTDNPFTLTEQLPILTISLAAPAEITSGQTITYTATLTNIGQAAASSVNATITLPNGTQQTLNFGSGPIPPAGSVTATASYPVPLRQASGPVSAQAVVTWHDAVTNSYGPLSSSATTNVKQANQPPVVNAGPNQTVPFPNAYPLQGHVTDDGLPNATLISTWTQISGPSQATFSDPHSPTSTALLTAIGTYVFRLTGDDSQLQASADVAITTTSANLPPLVKVGPDQTITLPVNTVSLTGNATDDGLPAGSVLTFQWSKVAGPGTVTFANATSPNTSATFSDSGTYLLRLTASDSQLTGSAQMRVTVLPFNDPPVVNAGPDQTIIWPTNTVTLAGIATDDGMPAGSVLKTNWAFVSGPTAVLFGDPTVLNTTVRFNSPGTYILRLTADDSQFRSSDDVTITVRSLIDAPPHIISSPITQFITDPSATPLPTYTYIVVATDPENDPLDYMLTTFPAGMSIDSVTGAITWTPTQNDLGPHTVSIKVREASGQFDTQTYVLNVVTQSSISPLGTLVLSPASAGPVVVGTAQQLQAFFTDGNNAPVANAVITFTVTGPNATSGTATTNSSGKATFVYSGATSGVDSIVASTSASSTTLNSNTSTINWVVPAQPISTTTINGRIFASNGSGPFNTPPTATPAFVQNFPTINFNPPTGTVPGMPGSIGVNTRPFTDVTTDLNGNFTGSIVVQGNGLQAGVGALFNFQAVFTGSYTVAAAGNVTFNFFSDDGFIFGVNNGATRVSGSLFNPPPSGLTPFQGYPVMGAFNTATAPVANSITVHFPGPGTYQYEIDYSECCAGELAVTMTSSLSGNHGVPSSGTVTLTPGTNVSKSIGGTATFSALLTDASGAIIPNVPVLFNVAGANTIQFQGVSDSTGRATFSYQSFRTGTDIVQANAQITGMTAVSNQTLVTWNSAANTAPVVNAGTNQTITLPTNSATLNGTATDDGLPSGTLTTTWTQISGPVQAAIANPNQLATVVSFTQPGSYVFKLSATDSVLTTSANVTITVNQQNLAPSISISVDSTVITQPANTILVTGTVTDDGFPTGSTLSTQWTDVSGPAAATFSNPNSPNTSITLPTAGTYVLKLSASDSQLTSSVNVTITVNPPAPNQAPTVTIVASQTLITLPSNVVTLSGRISDDGLPLGAPITTAWSQVSGPLPVTFSTPAGSSTQVGFPAAGTYVLQLAASDSQLTGSATISITVNAVGTNQAPTVAIIADHTSITLPTNTVTLNGVINDDGLPNGTIATQWTQISGPAAVNIAQVTSTSVKVAFPAAGVYVIRLTANDGQLSSEATITITVTTSGGNQPPTVSAGPSQSVQLPQNAVTLNGYAADDGLPAGSTLLVSWSEISGPASVSFSNPSSVTTQATFSVAGVYVLQLSASDSQLQTTAQVTITVANAPVQPPTPPSVSFTGFTDGQEITKPTPIIGSVTTGSWKLEYSLLDGSGNPTTFTTFSSGAAPVTNSTLGTFDPTVLLNGQYVVRFSSTDNASQTSTTSSTVDVSRNTKVGNFTLSFNDLSVPLPGLPITVTRTYDSRDKRVGDFGVGWTLSVANVRVQKTGGAIGTGWDEEVQWSGFFPTYCLQPVKNHTVSVTFPDGKVYKFQAASSPACQQIVPITNPQIAFTQISTGASTANATLTPIGDVDFLLDGGVPGPVNILDFDLNFADYSQFQLTTAEGYSYILDQQRGATRVTDPTGNTLTLNTNGMISSTGKSVAFTRDLQNRITQITDPSGNSLLYAYNGAGDLVSFTDRAGNATTFVYDTNHLLQNIVDPRGVQAIRNTYDDAGRLTATTDASGNTIHYAHEVAANQEIVTDRLGNPTLYEYDDDGNILHMTDALGNVTSSTFDANDNRLSVINALNQTTLYTYDSAGNQLSMTDALGHTTRSTFNARNQVLATTDALDRVTTNTYDSNGNLLTTTDPLGKVTTATYNSQGLALSVKDALGNITAFTYDGNGNVSTQTDALGNVSSFTYDANGNRLTQAVKRTSSGGALETLTTQYQYDADNRLTKTIYPDGSTRQVVYNALGKKSDMVDELGRTTHFDYDANGRLIKTTYPDSTTDSATYDANDQRISSTDRAGRTTIYTYDALGRLIKTAFPDGSSTSTTYDAIGEIIASTDALGNTIHFQYDAAHRRIHSINALNQITSFTYDAAGNQTSAIDALNHTIQFTYDGANTLTKTTFPDATTLSSVYDALGRQISRTDQAGKVTSFSYDALGRMTSVTDALNQATRFGYDELGNRITQTDANNHTTSFAFDQKGRRIQKKLPLGQVESYSYNAAGNLTTRTDFNGHTTAYAYDALNRLTSKQADPFFTQNGLGASQVNFSYTPTGQRASMSDASGTTTYTYDTRDRLLSKATPFGTLTYTYDAAGNVLTIGSSNTGGASITYTYDLLNRLASAGDVAGTTTYSYDAAGNLAGFAYPNGTSSSYAYDGLNRLTQMQTVCGTGSACNPQGGVIARFDYTLGATGNRLSVAELNGRTVQYAYDALYRLSSETILGAASQNGTIAYQYDAVGNRMQLTSTVAAIASGLMNYDANDRAATLPFDDNGNQLNSGSGNNLFDFENHLVKSGAITLMYDGDGNRVAKTVVGSTTNYLVDSNNLTGYAQVLDELQNDAVTRTYSYGLEMIDERQTVSGSPATSFYGYDGHGSVRFLTNPAGAVTDTYDYDAFGNLISSTGATPNNYKYAGQQFDPNLNLYYSRARYLDVRNGRFLTADAFEGDPSSPLSLHRYVYVLNEPVLLADPSGYTPLSDFANQLNGYLRRLGGDVANYTARKLGQIAHTAIEADVAFKLIPKGYAVLAEVVIPGGRIDLIVDKGIYEIKPLGGTVDPQPQLGRYLAAKAGYMKGTYPFDDFVNKDLLPLPLFVSLHYELADPGLIEYDYQFDYKVLLPLVVYALVRIGQAAYQAITETEVAEATLTGELGFAF